MGLYNLFSYNVEVQYKSYFLSKAMIFTLITTTATIILPFVLAYRSRGFWMKSHSFFEQPVVHFTYEYIIVAETEDPSHPIVCAEIPALYEDKHGSEYCAVLEVAEYDYNSDNKNDAIEFSFSLIIPPNKSIVSVIIILGLNFQLKTICPLNMQSLAVINYGFSMATSGLKFYGDLQFHQTVHLPCLHNYVDIKYNSSLLSYSKESNDNIVDVLLEEYFKREVATQVNTIYSRSQHGSTGASDFKVHLKIPEMKIRYKPSLLQELKWAWPQYLSIAIVFHWLFSKVKRFVFNNRLLMAWEILPWKKIK